MRNETGTYPLVSVFIPTYNTGQFLTQAIDSVLSQTYQNYQLIIVNDGSTDNTVDLLKQYQAHLKVTIHHNSKNMGISPTWNIALGLCRGEFIAKLDSDDFYEPNQLETVVEFFQQHPEVGLVFSGLSLIYPDGRCETEMRFRRSWVRNRAKFLPILLDRCIIRAPTVVVRRTCYEQLGGVIEQMRLHSDWEMWVRVAANYPVGFIARRLANYRLSYGSNATAQAIMDGRNLYDLKLWLDLLAADKLPYRLRTEELNKLRWGIYDLVMHFAGIAAYHDHKEMQETYTAFAEEVLSVQSSAVEIEYTRQVYINLHQAIFAFREKRLQKAQYHLLQAVTLGPSKWPWTWRKLLLSLKIIKRIIAGFYRRAILR